MAYRSLMEEKPKRTRQKKTIEEKPKKTSGKSKKPIQVVAVVTPDGIEGTFTPEARRPLIVHLPFQSTEVTIGDVMSDIKYDPNPPPQPIPYDENSSSYFQVNSENSSSELEIGVEQEGWKMSIEKSKQMSEVSKEDILCKEKNTEKEGGCIDSIKSLGEKGNSSENTVFISSIAPIKPVLNVEPSTPVILKSKLMIQYETKPGETLKVPDSTELSCFWTTHEFSGSPYFIPIREENGIYTVYGNFSSPECALAYLLNEHIDSHVRWERMSLLHRMYKLGGRIYPAPPRESLKKFGGCYTIEEYTKILNDGRVRIDIHAPPLISILGTLDTKPIDFYDSSVQNTFTGGFSMDRFRAWSEQGGALRLKRSKPLKDRESTLDSCIQISIKRG